MVSGKFVLRSYGVMRVGKIASSEVDDCKSVKKQPRHKRVYGKALQSSSVTSSARVRPRQDAGDEADVCRLACRTASRRRIESDADLAFHSTNPGVSCIFVDA